MVLKKGIAVPVRVEDPGQLLSQHEGKTPGAHLLIGVTGDSFVFHPALVISKDSAGRDHQIIVPFDTPVKLVVASAFFHLNDSVGAALSQAATTSLPINIPAGQAPTVVRLTVTGAGK